MVLSASDATAYHDNDMSGLWVAGLSHGDTFLYPLVGSTNLYRDDIGTYTVTGEGIREGESVNFRMSSPATDGVLKVVINETVTDSGNLTFSEGSEGGSSAEQSINNGDEIEIYGYRWNSDNSASNIQVVYELDGDTVVLREYAVPILEPVISLPGMADSAFFTGYVFTRTLPEANNRKNGVTYTYAITGNPSGLTFDTSTRELSAVSGNSITADTYELTYTVTGSDTSTVSKTFDVIVVPTRISGLSVNTRAPATQWTTELPLTWDAMDGVDSYLVQWKSGGLWSGSVSESDPQTDN